MSATVARTQMPTGGFRETTVDEFWLTEEQALFLVADAQEFIFCCLDFSAGYAASALSLLGTVEERCEEVHHGRRTMVQALQVIDACSQLPARFLLAPGFWEGSTIREVLVAAIRHAAVLLASLERAAAELGLEPFDGGLFALPGGAR